MSLARFREIFSLSGNDDSDQGSGILIGTVSAIVPAGHLPGSDVYRTGNRTPFWNESYVIRVEVVVAFRGNESTHKAVRMFWPKPSLLCAYEGSDH